MQLLDQVIPSNYERMDFGGLEFKRFNEDGLDMSQRNKFDKYILKEDEKFVVVDSVQVEQMPPKYQIDNDLKPSQIANNPSIQEVEEALNEGVDDNAY